MRIVIDMQGAQSESRFRGIGRYCLSFALAVARNRGPQDEVVLALNAALAESIEPIRAAFDGLLPQSHIRLWHAPGPVAERLVDNDTRRATAEIVREAFLASLAPDVIHVGSLFEGYLDDAVTSIGRFDRRIPVSVTLHDLIPLLNPEHYLDPDPLYKRHYLRKFELLKNATLYLSNSDFTRREGLQHLQQGDTQRFVNVSSATEARFAPMQLSPFEESALRRKFGISGAFIMHAGAVDERKNIARLVRAFAALPPSLVSSHHLVLAGGMPEKSVSEFKRIAQDAGLGADRLCFTGWITDDDLVHLYNLCKLFIFPSWHEGFGLPALEAMSCGTPTIGARGTSLDEVIGLDSALFDPFDVGAISSKIAQVLQDDAFRAALHTHALEQAKRFSWDESARRAFEAWSSLSVRRTRETRPTTLSLRKPKLAFVSPLPPERTGVADYSAQLLPALSQHYEIDVVTPQHPVEDRAVEQHCAVRDPAWLREHARDYDRVLYQMGNSALHAYMLPLLREVPGTLVLHDFYLSALLARLQYHEGAAGAWDDALYAAYGYKALADRFRDPAAAQRDYPVNLELLQRSRGVIVHSNHARDLVGHWCGNEFAASTEVVPLVRPQPDPIDRDSARTMLGIGKDDFLVCSFGFLGLGKLNHRLLDAWAASALSHDTRYRLVFVGETHDPAYRDRLLAQVRDSRLSKQVQIAGFVSSEVYRRYLSAADLAVQLRADSRGETSAAALDAMSYGIALIANAGGSMTELPRDAVRMLPAAFDDTELVRALEELQRSSAQRDIFGVRARELIARDHAPNECAQRYRTAIEHFYNDGAPPLPQIVQAIALQEAFRPDPPALVALSQALALSFALPAPERRLLIDVSIICREDTRTGIQRVVRSLLLEWLHSPPAGFRVEPVYLFETEGRWALCAARRYTCSLLDCSPDALVDDIIEPDNGDVLVALDLSQYTLVSAEQSGLFRELRNRGVAVHAVVFDLLPVLMPEVFPAETELPHANWLKAISNLDGVMCISKAVADEFSAWRTQQRIDADATERRPFRIEWFHLGSDVESSAPSKGLPADHAKTLVAMRARPTFLVVGTIEPRKGYLQTLEAFERSWHDGLDINLVIVGKEGWKPLPENMRRDIPETVRRLREHPENGGRLFWLEAVSDEYLEKIYATSDCLIAASYGEGFGLPLIEAARHGLPIIARDIPVFREVAGSFAFYFNAPEASGLAEAISNWLALYHDDRHPKSTCLPWLTWKQSAGRFIQPIVQDHYKKKEGGCDEVENSYPSKATASMNQQTSAASLNQAIDDL